MWPNIATFSSRDLQQECRHDHGYSNSGDTGSRGPPCTRWTVEAAPEHSVADAHGALGEHVGVGLPDARQGRVLFEDVRRRFLLTGQNDLR